MATFMVWVNQRFMVKVDANSNGGAEHRILDNYELIQGAQAFEIGKDTRTEYFENVMMDAKLISLDELRGLSDEYIGHCNSFGKAMQRIKDVDRQIEELKEELVRLEQLRIEVTKEIRIAENDIAGIKITMNLKEG